MMVACGRIAEEVMLQLCQQVLDRKGTRMNGKPALWCEFLREKEM